MDYCHFNMEKCCFLFILSIFCSYFVNYSSFFPAFLCFFYIFPYFPLFLSMFWNHFVSLWRNQHFYMSVFVCFYQLKTCTNVIWRKNRFFFPNIIPCVPSFLHVHAKFHVFLYSPVKSTVFFVFPAKIFPEVSIFPQSDGYLRSIFAAKRITVHSVTSNTLYNAQDTYLCSLSLHTVENCAKITCIGLYNCGLFFIFIFLYKEVINS